MTWVISALLVVTAAQAVLLARLFRRLATLDVLDARVQRFGAALTLLTDTTEAGLTAMAGALDQIDKRRAARPAQRTAVVKRVVAAARSGRDVPRIARDEALSESEVRLHLAMASPREAAMASSRDAASPRNARQ